MYFSNGFGGGMISVINKCVCRAMISVFSNVFSDGMISVFGNGFNVRMINMLGNCFHGQISVLGHYCGDRMMTAKQMLRRWDD